MADQTLALTYYPATGRVTHAGLTSGIMPSMVATLLSSMGILFGPASNEGRLVDNGWLSTAAVRGNIVNKFNARFDQDPNPFHATDNLTLTLTEA